MTKSSIAIYNYRIATRMKDEREGRKKKMSEEQIKIWKKVEAKDLEKLGNIEKALLEKEGFKEAHKDYCDFVNRLAETTGMTTGELDRHFATLLAEKKDKEKE